MSGSHRTQLLGHSAQSKYIHNVHRQVNSSSDRVHKSLNNVEQMGDERKMTRVQSPVVIVGLYVRFILRFISNQSCWLILHKKKNWCQIKIILI